MVLRLRQRCRAACASTQSQGARLPEALRGKGRTERTLGGVTVGPNTRVVTYVSRGFESMRGFDKFMQAADLIAKQYPDVIFIVVGTDRVAYGGDENYIAPHKTFKEWVFAKQQFDLSKFAFVGRLAPEELGKLLASSDLHIYLTVPFVLSWSMMDAMSCGAVVLGSDTAPVREMIRDGENGLLADFFDSEAMAAKAVEVLRDPDAARPLGRAAEQMIVERYSLDAVLPRMLELYEQAASIRLPGWSPPPPTPVPAPRTVQPTSAARPPAAPAARRTPFRG